MLLDRSVLGEELLRIFNFFTASSTYNKRKQKRSPSDKRDKIYYVFASSRWERLLKLLKAIEQLLGTAKRVPKKRWKMPKGFG